MRPSKLQPEYFVGPEVTETGSPRLKQVGQFRVGRCLGKGTSASAYVGTHVESGFKVALKTIKKPNQNPARWKVIRQEIAAMKLMDHPHVLKLYDVFETDDRIIMVEELAKSDLFDFIKSGTPPRETVLRIIAEVTMGLLHCHNHGVVHRDLKLENIFLDERGGVKIADFGMARFAKQGYVMNTSCGSPHYVSPEVISGRYEGKMSDVWSLGVILYATATATLPFCHDSLPELLKLIQAGIYQAPEVDSDIVDLISRMLQVDVKNRIRMEDIQSHRAFAGTWYFESNVNSIPAASHEPIVCIDENTFEDLAALLSCDTRSEIVFKLKQSGGNIEKTIYNILEYRRADRIKSLSRLSPKSTKARRFSFGDTSSRVPAFRNLTNREFDTEALQKEIEESLLPDLNFMERRPVTEVKMYSSPSKSPSKPKKPLSGRGSPSSPRSPKPRPAIYRRPPSPLPLVLPPIPNIGIHHTEKGSPVKIVYHNDETKHLINNRDLISPDIPSPPRTPPPQFEREDNKRLSPISPPASFASFSSNYGCSSPSSSAESERSSSPFSPITHYRYIESNTNSPNEEGYSPMMSPNSIPLSPNNHNSARRLPFSSTTMTSNSHSSTSTTTGSSPRASPTPPPQPTPSPPPPPVLCPPLHRATTTPARTTTRPPRWEMVFSAPFG